MKKIFRKDKYIKYMLNIIIEKEDYRSIVRLADAIRSDGWATYCDGKEVINGKIDMFDMPFFNDWCDDVEDEPILDAKEKAYLEAVLKPFKNRITFIEKEELLETMEYIICGIDYDDFISFPYFIKGTMYKNMEDDKPYTSQELGLFENE